jgi:type I restriction enzyme S subunit
VPPLAEQREMISAITAKTASLNIVIVRSEQEIRLLQEYRNRLVSDVVTGKLDVRDAAAKLPADISLDITSDEGFGDDTDTPDEEASE